MSKLPIRHALISVFDKSGLGPLCQALAANQTQLYSTGGTADFIEKLGCKVTRIEKVTQFPEMMDGRVKTLHPKVFGGILARRDNPKDLEQAKASDIPLFDLIVVNLYPFWDHLGETPKEQSAFVDIGGPSMLRAAAKNHESVTVLSHSEDYAGFLEHYQGGQGTTLELRRALAAKTFGRTSQYDAMIASQWGTTAFPTEVSLVPQTPLRYGENPHQKAAFVGSPSWKSLQGKELSYNNLLDAEAAYRIVNEFTIPALSIIKHNNPCGVAAGKKSLADLYSAALESDSRSAFGGVIATNQVVDFATAEKMASLFIEVIVAKGFDDRAKEVLSQKKNLRLVEWPNPSAAPFELRAAMGGWLIQEADKRGIPDQFQAVTELKITSDAIWEDVRFAWLVCKHVRSNAIVIAKGGQTVGTGAGQMSRVDAMQIAIQKAGNLTQGATIASDAFFPFRDNIDLLKGLGIAAIVQPGGSQRDPEVIQACNELGIAMVFTGNRHFKH